MVGRRLGRSGQHYNTKRRWYHFCSRRLSDRTLDNIRRGTIPNSIGGQGPEDTTASEDLVFDNLFSSLVARLISYCLDQCL